MAANSKVVAAPDTISPKVFWPLLVAVALTFAGTALAAVTPDMLGGAGAFAVPLALGLQAVAMTVTGYLKGDTLRSIGSEATAAILPDAPVSSETVPATSSVDVPVTEDDTTAAALEAELSSLNAPDGTGSHRASGITG